MISLETIALIGRIISAVLFCIGYIVAWVIAIKEFLFDIDECFAWTWTIINCIFGIPFIIWSWTML